MKINNEVKHTPRLKIDPQRLTLVREDGVPITSIKQLENIVRAVNSHEALVTAIEAAIIHIRNDKVKEMFKNILAQAEEK